MNFLPTPETKPADLVAEFVSLRNQKKAAEDKMAEFIREHYSDRMRQIEMQLLDFLNTSGSNSIAGPAGTAYKKTDTSVTVADARAFREYVMDSARFDLIDWRAAKVAVMEQVETEGVLPPGLNFSQRVSVGIRKGN